MLAAEKYLGAVGVGVTLPQFFQAENGKTYLVKLRRASLNKKILFNERLAAQLGKILGLRFPPSDMIYIDEDLIRQNDILIQLEVLPGWHFASEYLENTGYIDQRRLRKATNTEELAGIVLFDHLLLNKDRAHNRKNMIIQQTTKEWIVYGIDHSHLFGSCNWTGEGLKERQYQFPIYYGFVFNQLFKDYLSLEDFTPYQLKAEKITWAQIEDLVWEVPWNWLPDQAEREAVIRFLFVRFQHTAEVMAVLARHILTERGGQKRWNRRMVLLNKRKN